MRPYVAALVALSLFVVTAFSTGARAEDDFASDDDRSAAAEAAPRASQETADRSAERPAAQRLAFREGTRPIGWGDLVTTTAYVGGLLALRAVDSPESPAWTRVNGFDAFMRDRLRLAGGGRAAIATASDALLFTVAAYPVVIDDLALSLIGDRNPGLAARLMAIDAQAYALMSLIMGLTKIGAARERPYAYGAGCRSDPEAPGCQQEDRNMSFFSGHASMAFTGASLACFHQQQVPGLYGSREAGLAVCGSAMALATSTALFRVLSDKHWTTDVLMGAGVGVFSGWLLPWLTHGRTVLDFQGERVNASLSPSLERGGFGLNVSGSF